MRSQVSSPANNKSPDLNTALLQAIGEAQYEQVVTLLEQGADPNYCHEYETPLIVAAKQKSSTSAYIIKCLLEKGAHVNVNPYRKFSLIPSACYALNIAVEYGNEDAIKLLLPLVDKADINIENRVYPWYADYLFTLISSSEISDQLIADILSLFAEYNINLNIRERGSEGETLLNVSISNSLSLALLLLERGADPGFSNDKQENALHTLLTKYFTFKSDTTVSQLEKHFQQRQQCFMLDEMLTILQEKGLDINAKVKSQKNALMTATYYSYDGELIKILLKHNADPNLQDKHGKHALHYAVDPFGAVSIGAIQILLNYGADPLIKNNKGETPLATFVARCIRHKISSFEIDGGYYLKRENFVKLVEHENKNKQIYNFLLQAMHERDPAIKLDEAMKITDKHDALTIAIIDRYQEIANFGLDCYLLYRILHKQLFQLKLRPGFLEPSYENKQAEYQRLTRLSQLSLAIKDFAENIAALPSDNYGLKEFYEKMLAALDKHDDHIIFTYPECLTDIIHYVNNIQAISTTHETAKRDVLQWLASALNNVNLCKQEIFAKKIKEFIHYLEAGALHPEDNASFLQSKQQIQDILNLLEKKQANLIV